MEMRVELALADLQ